MLRALFRTLNVKPTEERQVLFLLAKGFCMGVFIATFQVVAETLFMSRLGDYLRHAILVSGAIGIVSTFLFAKLQERIRFSTLILSTEIIIFLIAGACYYTFVHAPEYELYVIFMMFALSGPFLAILLLGFWGVFGRLFDLRQSKRIIGGIDIGQLSAAILASFAIPVLGRFIPQTENFLIICGISILLSAFFLILITRNFDLTKAEVSKIARRKSGFNTLFRDKYIRLLSTFLICSMVTFTFVQYSFLDVADQQYPNEDELRNFFAIFNGSILILGLILQTFVNEKIISEYGLKVSLMIQPIILAIFTFCVIAVGKTFGYNIMEAGDNFLFFFLFVALSRLFNFSLRDSLENPVFKLYFMPLDNSERFDIQTKVEGVVNETARFLAGLLIFGLSLFTFFEVIHYSYVLIFLISSYFLIIGKIYVEYRNKLKLKLKDQQQDFVDQTQQQQEIVYRKLKRSLKENKIGRVIFAIKLLEKIDPGRITHLVNQLINSTSEEVKNYAVMRMNEIKGLSVSHNYIINLNDPEKSKGRQLLGTNDLDDLLRSGNVPKSRIFRLLHSQNIEDRLYAVEVISNNPDEHNIPYLLDLLSDTNYSVKLAAIRSSIHYQSKEIIGSLINILKDPVYASQAINSLVMIGGKALSQMESAFYRTGQSLQVMIKLVQAMGRIGGNKAEQQLWNKIDYPDKVIISQVLLSLSNCGFKASISQITRIKFAIETDIANIAWNMAAKEIISYETKAEDIKQALQEEIKSDIDHIYMLLGMLYDSHSIQLVKENIDSGTNEGVSYGLELLDVFLSEDLKQKILPILDDISIQEKIKKLEVYYSKPEYELPLLLKLLLNRDYNQANRYTKACVLDFVAKNNPQFYKIDLVAQLFNDDKMLQELAAWALYTIQPVLYKEHVKRLPQTEKKRLDDVILENYFSRRYETIKFFKNLDIFKGTPGLLITQLMDISTEFRIAEGEMFAIDSIRNNCFYIVKIGSVNLYEKGSIKANLGKGEFIGEVTYSSDYIKSGLIIAVENSLLLQIPKDQFYDLLSDNIRLAQNIVEFI
jgi:AAA family ATP:ADP antiporter